MCWLGFEGCFRGWILSRRAMKRVTVAAIASRVLFPCLQQCQAVAVATVLSCMCSHAGCVQGYSLLNSDSSSNPIAIVGCFAGSSVSCGSCAFMRVCSRVLQRQSPPSPLKAQGGLRARMPSLFLLLMHMQLVTAIAQCTAHNGLHRRCVQKATHC